MRNILIYINEINLERQLWGRIEVRAFEKEWSLTRERKAKQYFKKHLFRENEVVT